MALRLPRRVAAIAAAALASAAVLATTATPSHAATACGTPDRAATPTQYKPGSSDYSAASTLLCMVIDERERRGLEMHNWFWWNDPVRNVLSTNSTNHMNDLIAHGKTGTSLHTGSNGSTPVQRMAGYTAGASSWRVGELVTPVGRTPKEAFDSFMNSQYHREALLSTEFKDIAIAANGRTPGGGAGGTYVVSLGVRR